MKSLLAILSLLFVFQLKTISGARFSAGMSNAVPESSSLPVGYVAYPEIGSAYKVHNVHVNLANWTRSEEICVLEGGHLAVIDNYLKLKYALITPIADIFVNRHVGIHLVNGSWVSIDNGRNLPHIQWGKDEPFSYDGYTCAAIGFTDRGSKIRSEPCEYEGEFICEIPLASHT